MPDYSDPLDAARRKFIPRRTAQNPRLFTSILSTDEPVSFGISALDLARPPSQIPLSQLPLSKTQMEMQDWYADLINRFMNRRDVKGYQQFSM